MKAFGLDCAIATTAMVAKITPQIPRLSALSFKMNPLPNLVVQRNSVHASKSDRDSHQALRSCLMYLYIVV